MADNALVMDDLTAHIPESLRQVFSQIVVLTDAFCDEHLNDEYKELCRGMAVAICQEGSPVKRGKVAGWACGIVNALGWVNFLGDPSIEPYMRLGDVAKGFGVSQQTMATRSKAIREGLGLVAFDPDWCLPSLMDDNPLIWMVEVNGFVMDIRCAPREIQKAAYDQGVIPYLPDAQEQVDSSNDVVDRIGS